MEQNEVIKQVIETIRKDIVSDKAFIKEILDNYRLTIDNIPPELTSLIMSNLNLTQKRKLPVSNKPRDMKGTKAAKPAISSDSTITKIVSDLLEGNNVYLMGKAGTGKTYLAETIAQDIMGQPVFIINCSQWTSPIEIRGGQTITGYEEGQLIKAWAEGGILILDELPKLDPNTAGLLNSALAKTADQPKYDDNGKLIEGSIPFIVNGKGEKIYKGQGTYNETTKTWTKPDENIRFRFGVIGTGNTDMMNVGNKYGGNQRQDYSLVDRFAGSYYTIENNPTLEQSLTYNYVWNICDALRTFLDENKLLQSISLRTMLNFNRTYEQEMLNYFDSKAFSDEIYDGNGNRVAPKTLDDSLISFKSMMEKSAVEKLDDYDKFRDATSTEAKIKARDSFQDEFMLKYHLDPITGAVLTEEQIEKLNSRKK